ncbi:hypothetical protein E6W39_20380 [Kitasatospora acidiphila]|uniref:Uncharacterized protein n=1 Tax=Kitasatospora acidiphila TaxID=2567942 RepID=A0A540W546_9ACTN|nr:substrate-binding domain-containing protein [Kitasatospora acidiphila]TQF04155.1 hypothetical protein E6W39_20380 [Kitasatospora acidiphila]
MPWAAAHRPRVGRVVALLLSFFVLTLSQATPALATTTLNADGSSWAGPAIEKWRTDVANQGINLNFAPNGSAAGRNNWENGSDDFTASDVPFRTQRDTGASGGSPAPVRPMRRIRSTATPTCRSRPVAPPSCTT